MKYVMKKAALILMALPFIFTACKKSDSGSNLVSYKFKVLYPETYLDKNVANASVKITNTITGSTATANTNDSGYASFTSLLPGTYMLSTSKTLTAAEGLKQTGISAEVFLNGALGNFNILASGEQQVRLKGSGVGGLVFKEIYWTGSRTPANGSYYQDQFYEIYNNSTDTIYADSLCIADVAGNPRLSATSVPSGFKGDDNFVYAGDIWMVPGTGKTNPIAPGKSILIAEQGINHKSDPLGNANSPVNLGKGTADWETYVEASGRDIDAVDVPNMILINRGSSTFTWLTSVFGPSMIIFRHPDPAGLKKVAEPNSTSTRLYPQVPIANVIDGVDGIASAAATNFKRLPTAVDAGYQFCSGTYVGESIKRKTKSTVNGRRVLQDTNNSTEDFEVTKPPTPKTW